MHLRRPTNTRLVRVVSLALCSSLIISAMLLPTSRVGATGATNASGPVERMGSNSFLGTLLALLQGGGGSLLTSGTPGANLPDLDAARNIAFAEPVAPAPINSTLACSTCTPCTGTCDPAASHAPVAFVNGPSRGTVNKAVAFDGGGSFDPDGDALTYAWSFGDGATATTAQSVAHVYTATGTYTVTLTVTDSQGQANSAATTVTITTVSAPPPPPPGTGANVAEFVAQSVPTSMDGGQSYAVSVTMRNTGTSTWTAAHLYRLGVQNPSDNSNWSISRVAVPYDIGPSQTVTFNFTVIAPRFGVPVPHITHPYNFQWQMVQDGVAGYGQLTQNVVVNVRGIYTGVTSQPAAESLWAARLDPNNRVGTGGDDLLSRNFNWGVPLVGLPGRAGLDLALSLSYNSLVWTKVGGAEAFSVGCDEGPCGGAQSGATITFDADQGFPAPGFRLGLPALHGPFSDDAAGANAYLLVLPSGQRVELRQAADGSFLAVDSSNLQLLTGGNGQALVRAPDGTQFTYVTVNGDYRCTSIKDRNGNFIAAAYNNIGRLTTLTDTLGRVISFNYDTNNRLLSLSQMRGSTQHLWATFGYGALPIQTNFHEANGNALIVQGPQNGTNSTVLTQVGLDDGSFYTFDYTSWGQMATVTHHAADTHPLAYTSYNLPTTTSTTQADCPRFTERHDWAENWNGNQPAVTKYFVGSDADGSWVGVSRPDAPDDVVHKEYYTPTGLLLRSADYAADNLTTPQKVTTVDWTQDDPGATYLTNPRPTQTDITDAAGNIRRTAYNYTAFGLVSDVYELGGTSNPLTYFRRTHIDYNLNTAYLSRHIIGLVTGQYVFGPENNGQQLYSKATFGYDEGTLAGYDGGKGLPTIPTQHDTTYDANFRLRGNQTSGWRYAATAENDAAQALVSHAVYNPAGSLVATTDPAGHLTKIKYADAYVLGSSFMAQDVSAATPSDDAAPLKGSSLQTLAYPTSVIDADDFISTVKYDFYTGLTVRAQGPPPQGASEGAIQAMSYDAAGRGKQVNTFLASVAEQSNSPYRYTRHSYPTSQTIVNTYATVQEGAGEVYAATVFDGAGQVRATASDFPNSTGHYHGTYALYDVLGQVIRQYRPTEMNNAWSATGDDAVGWYYTLQTYDWKGRPLRTTNSDNTYREAAYGGCGCAGGAVVTLTDEVGRRQQTYADPLGRVIKSQLLNKDDNYSIYATTTQTYNPRDQVTSGKQYQGGISGTYQETLLTYDGYGRTATAKAPIQTGTVAYVYNPDSSVQQVTDARGINTQFTYNARHLVTGVTYERGNITSVPTDQGGTTPVNAAPWVTYTYDAAGNRTAMATENGAGGSATYTYDNLSQLTAEARQFPGLAGTYSLAYEYTLAGALKQVTDQTASTSFTTSYDNTGQLTGVSGVGYQGAATQFTAQMQYRAWGALKALAYGNGTSLNLGYDQRGRASSYAVGGVQLAGLTQTIGATYQYYADGQVKSARDQSGPTGAPATNSVKDRAYQYDFAGRLSEAYSGGEARDVINNTTGGAADGPFRQSYAYDAWGNMTAGGGRFWSRSNVVTTASYNAAARNSAWEYDAGGHLISRNEPADNQLAPYQPARYSYDAAGREVSVTQTRSYFVQQPSPQLRTNVFNNTQTYDGDGQQVRYVRGHLVNNQPAFDDGRTLYQLRSSVLGGAVVSEYNAQGAWQVSYVYAGGERVGQQGKAEDGAAWNVWRHVDPVTGDELNTSPAGIFLGQTTLDPQGVDVSVSDPFPANGSGDDDGLFQPDEGVPAKRGAAGLIGTIEGGAKCSLDGIMQDCGFVRGESTQQCPDNNCGARAVTTTWRRNGEVVASSTVLRAQGQAGWDGALDGTFRVGPGVRGGALNVWTGAAANGFLDMVARILHEHGDRNIELLYRVAGGAGGVPGSIGEIAANGFFPQLVSQQPLVEDDPDVIKGESNTNNCSLSVSFKSGTFYDGNPKLPNGPSTISYQGIENFGLGFTVSGTVSSGGIGTVGNQVNSQNPSGNWTIDQWTSGWIARDGKHDPQGPGGPAWRDINTSIPYSASGNSFTWYDHPGGEGWGIYRDNSFFVKVYRGDVE